MGVYSNSDLFFLALEACFVGMFFVVLNVPLLGMNGTVAVSTFLSGVLGHIFFQFSGVNKFYCENGYLVKKGFPVTPK